MRPRTYILLATPFVFVLLFQLLLWYFETPIDWRSLLRFAPGSINFAHLVAVGLIGGFLGGMIGARLKPHQRRRIEAMEQRISNLEWKSDLSRRNAPQPPTGFDDAPRMPVFAAPSAPVPPPSRHRAPEPAQSEAPPRVSIEDVVAGYARAASGHMSRAQFAEFFASWGKSGAVEPIDGGSSLAESRNEDAFLTAVNTGHSILVFPSYSFIANCDTQFSTVASVPEDVAQIFDLVRGDGNVMVGYPAIFNPRDDPPQLQSKGEIRGFAG